MDLLCTDNIDCMLSVEEWRRDSSSVVLPKISSLYSCSKDFCWGGVFCNSNQEFKDQGFFIYIYIYICIQYSGHHLYTVGLNIFGRIKNKDMYIKYTVGTFNETLCTRVEVL